MEGEMKNVMLVWATALASLLSCHRISKIIPPGTIRLCAFIPVFSLFFYLPLRLTSVHFSGTTSFFITWLASFKLLLFAFDKGPLAFPHLSLTNFILIASLPIKIKITSSSSSPPTPPRSISISISNKGYNYLINFILFLFLLILYQYAHHFHPFIKLALFSLHIYVVLDLGLALFAYLARAILGFHLEPHFHHPYLASSLQDFWGNRWNLMVTRILHPTVYLPVRSLSATFLPRKLAPLPAIMASFIVSGLMHELIFFYIGRLKPTWEVTWFFVIHGALVALELVVKRTVDGRFRLPAVVSGPLALGVVIATSFWLFFPPFLRCDTEVRSCKEFVAFMELVVRGNFVAPIDVSCPYF